MSVKKDVERLIAIYLELHELAGELYEIEERYPKARHFRKVIDSAKLKLDEASHMVFVEARELKQLEEKLDEQSRED